MNKSILIIDNNPDMRATLQTLLMDNGYQVIAIDAPENILNTMCQYEPELVLIEYMLPEINGGELCAQIKRSESFSNIPVILLSSCLKVLQSLGNYGSDEIIEKPLNSAYMLQRVSHYIHRRPRIAHFVKVDTPIYNRKPLL